MDKNIDLTSNPKKSFYNLSLPLVAFALFNTLYSVVDALWLSNASTEALFAVGVSIPIFTLFSALGDSFGQGTNSIMSRYLGSKHYENACNSFMTGIFIIIAIYIIILAFSTQYDLILTLLDISDNKNEVLLYLVPVTIASFVFLFSSFFSETLQAEGNSKMPTIVLIITNVLNILLDPIFIFNFNLGIRGAAYASILSAGICFLILLYWYLSKRTKIELSIKYIKIRLYVIDEILKVAIPNCLEDGFSSFTVFFIDVALLDIMGPIGIVLYVVSDSLKKFLLAPIKGFGRGLLSVSGHLFGAKKFDDMKKLYHHALNIGIFVSFILSIIFFVFHEHIYGLFEITSKEGSIYSIALSGIVILTLSPIYLITGKMFDGLGKSYYSLFFNILKKIFEIVGILLLSYFISGGFSILLTLVLAEVIFSVVYYVFFRYLFKKFNMDYADKEVVKIF